MRQQIAIALRRLEEQKRRAKKRYQPILFVVAVCKADAEKAEQTLNEQVAPDGNSAALRNVGSNPTVSETPAHQRHRIATAGNASAMSQRGTS